MVARVCAILMTLSALKIPWILEQPQSSILELSKPFQNLAKHFKVRKARGPHVAISAVLRNTCMLGQTVLGRSSCGLGATVVAVRCLKYL